MKFEANPVAIRPRVPAQYCLRWQKGRQGNGYDKLLIPASPLETKRIKLFRPDLSAHSVTKVEGATRYVLCPGWVLK